MVTQIVAILKKAFSLWMYLINNLNLQNNKNLTLKIKRRKVNKKKLQLLNNKKIYKIIMLMSNIIYIILIMKIKRNTNKIYSKISKIRNKINNNFKMLPLQLILKTLCRKVEIKAQASAMFLSLISIFLIKILLVIKKMKRKNKKNKKDLWLIEKKQMMEK